MPSHRAPRAPRLLREALGHDEAVLRNVSLGKRPRPNAAAWRARRGTAWGPFPRMGAAPPWSCSRCSSGSCWRWQRRRHTLGTPGARGGWAGSWHAQRSGGQLTCPAPSQVHLRVRVELDRGRRGRGGQHQRQRRGQQQRQRGRRGRRGQQQRQRGAPPALGRGAAIPPSHHPIPPHSTSPTSPTSQTSPTSPTPPLPHPCGPQVGG
jgi:hypothetical protein